MAITRDRGRDGEDPGSYTPSKPKKPVQPTTVYSEMDPHIALEKRGQEISAGLEEAQKIYREQQQAQMDREQSLLDEYLNARSGFQNDATAAGRESLQDLQNILNQQAARGQAGYNDYKSALNRYSSEAESQAADAKKTYQNTIMPQMQSNLEQANQYTQNAFKTGMTIAESMDPNNVVASGMRDLYGQAGAQSEADIRRIMGEGMAGYDIPGTRQRGLADYGILSAMGAQAYGQQLGSGVPMTGAQQQALQAATQRQASDAYSATQRRMQELEDQRRAYQQAMLGSVAASQDAYRMGGLSAGQAATQQGYANSEAARLAGMDRTAARIAELMGAEQDQQALQQSLRGERRSITGDLSGATDRLNALLGAIEGTGYEAKAGTRASELAGQLDLAREKLGIGQEKSALAATPADTQYQMSVDKAIRDFGLSGDIENLKMGLATAQEALKAAKEQASAQRQSGLLGALGTIGGGIAGGAMTMGNPAGVAGGAAIGGSVMNAMAPGQSSGGYQYQPIQSFSARGYYGTPSTPPSTQTYAPYAPGYGVQSYSLPGYGAAPLPGWYPAPQPQYPIYNTMG